MFCVPILPLKHLEPTLGIFVGCCYSLFGILGPYLFEVIIIDESYLKMLHGYVIPGRQLRVHYFEDLHFMQDAAPPHFTNTVHSFFERCFPVE